MGSRLVEVKVIEVLEVAAAAGRWELMLNRFERLKWNLNSMEFPFMT